MAEYKNGFNAFGGIPVDSSRLSSDVQTGRAVYVNEDEYSDEPDYKNRVDQTVNEGYHREAPFEAPEIVVPEPIIPQGTKDISENGVYDVAQFAKANVNVAGGGSSDFSTAEITFVNNTGGYLDEQYFDGAPGINDVEEDHYSITGLLYVPSMNSDTSVQVTIPLYKNSYCVVDEYITPSGKVISGTSGDITIDEEHRVHITGDCTITIS